MNRATKTTTTTARAFHPVFSRGTEGMTPAARLEAARDEVRREIAEAVAFTVRAEDGTLRDPSGQPMTPADWQNEERRQWISRLVYALDGEVPPFDPSVEMRELIEAAKPARMRLIGRR